MAALVRPKREEDQVAEFAEMLNMEVGRLWANDECFRRYRRHFFLTSLEERDEGEPLLHLLVLFWDALLVAESLANTGRRVTAKHAFTYLYTISLRDIDVNRQADCLTIECKAQKLCLILKGPEDVMDRVVRAIEREADGMVRGVQGEAQSSDSDESEGEEVDAGDVNDALPTAVVRPARCPPRESTSSSGSKSDVECIDLTEEEKEMMETPTCAPPPPQPRKNGIEALKADPEKWQEIVRSAAELCMDPEEYAKAMEAQKIMDAASKQMEVTKHKMEKRREERRKVEREEEHDELKIFQYTFGSHMESIMMSFGCRFTDKVLMYQDGNWAVSDCLVIGTFDFLILQRLPTNVLLPEKLWEPNVVVVKEETKGKRRNGIRIGQNKKEMKEEKKEEKQERKRHVHTVRFPYEVYLMRECTAHIVDPQKLDYLQGQMGYAVEHRDYRLVEIDCSGQKTVRVLMTAQKAQKWCKELCIVIAKAHDRPQLPDFMVVGNAEVVRRKKGDDPNKPRRIPTGTRVLNPWCDLNAPEGLQMRMLQAQLGHTAQWLISARRQLLADFYDLRWVNTNPNGEPCRLILLNDGILLATPVRNRTHAGHTHDLKHSIGLGRLLVTQDKNLVRIRNEVRLFFFVGDTVESARRLVMAVKRTMQLLKEAAAAERKLIMSVEAATRAEEQRMASPTLRYHLQKIGKEIVSLTDRRLEPLLKQRADAVSGLRIKEAQLQKYEAKKRRKQRSSQHVNLGDSNLDAEVGDDDMGECLDENARQPCWTPNSPNSPINGEIDEFDEAAQEAEFVRRFPQNIENDDFQFARPSDPVRSNKRGASSPVPAERPKRSRTEIVEPSGSARTSLTIRIAGDDPATELNRLYHTAINALKRHIGVLDAEIAKVCAENIAGCSKYQLDPLQKTQRPVPIRQLRISRALSVARGTVRMRASLDKKRKQNVWRRVAAIRRRRSEAATAHIPSYTDYQLAMFGLKDFEAEEEEEDRREETLKARRRICRLPGADKIRARHLLRRAGIAAAKEAALIAALNRKKEDDDDFEDYSSDEEIPMMEEDEYFDFESDGDSIYGADGSEAGRDLSPAQMISDIDSEEGQHAAAHEKEAAADGIETTHDIANNGLDEGAEKLLKEATIVDEASKPTETAEEPVAEGDQDENAVPA